MLSTTVTLTGTSGNDAFLAEIDGNNVDFYVNSTPGGGSPVQTVPVSQLGSVVVDGSGGTDIFMVYAPGATFTLGASAASGLDLEVDGGTVQVADPTPLASAGVGAAGTLDLTAATSFSGPVSVAGRLQVDNGGSGSATTTLSGTVSTSGAAADVDVTAGTLSVPGSVGLAAAGTTLTLDGSGTLTMPNWTIGNATVVQTDGTVSIPGTLQLGTGETATGTFDLNGGDLSVYSVDDGYFGYGVLDQTAGTLAVTFTTVGQQGFATTGVGVLDQSGGTSQLGALAIGFYGGTGTFDLSGGQSNANFMNVGILGSQGTFDLSGTGSFSADDEALGGDGGTGTVDQTGGTNTPRYGIFVGGQDGSSATGYFTLTGGTLTDCGSLTVGPYSGGGGTSDLLGVYTQTGGTATIAGSLIIGQGSAGSASVSGGTLAVTANAYVGYAAAGTLAVSGNGLVTDANALYVSGDGVDGDPAGVGTVTLSGSGRLTTQQTYVGYTGPATFDQTGGTDTAQTLVLNGPSGRYADYSVTGGTVDTTNIVNVQQPSAGGLPVVDEGSTYTLDLSGTASAGGNAITSWQVAWGDGSSGDISGDPSTATHTFTSGGTTYTVTSTAQGGGHSYPAGSVAVLVNDLPALVLIGGHTSTSADPVTLSNNVGQATTLSATFTDPGVSETHTALVNWGDGTFSTATVSESGGSGTITASHAYALHGSYQPTLEVTDSGGATAIVPFAVDVAYVAPALSVNAGQASATAGQPTTLVLHDAGPEAASAITSWTVDWGDGTSPQTVTAPPDTSVPAGGTWTVSHTYMFGGNYTATATATDSAGPQPAVSVGVTVAAAANNLLADGSFEDAGVDGVNYDPTGTAWAYAGNSGVETDDSAWGAANAPDGVQAAFLASDATSGNGDGAISQSVWLEAGTYTLSFEAASGTNVQPIAVEVSANGGTPTTVATVTPASADFAAHAMQFTVAEAGEQTITFAAVGAAGDTVADGGQENGGGYDSFIDRVELVSGATAAYPAPANLTATVASATEVDLSWPDVAGEVGFTVQRSPDGSTGWTTIGTTVTGVTTFADAGLTAGTTYYYRVEATDAGEGTAWSPTAMATTAPVPSGAPTLTATPVNAEGGYGYGGWIALAWTDVSGDEGFQVYRGTTAGGLAAYRAPLPAGTTTFDDYGADEGTTYFYAVAPLGGGGTASAAASATLAADPALPTAAAATDPVLVSSVTSTSAVITFQTLGPNDQGYVAEYGTDPTFAAYQKKYAGTGGTGIDGLDAGTTYYVRIMVDGPDASYLQPISFVTASVDAPPAPTFIYTRPLSSTEVEVSWESIYQQHADSTAQPAPPAGTPLEYAVEYSADGVNYTTAATIPLAADPYVSRYIVRGLEIGTSYVFRLRVTDPTAGIGGQSGSITSTSSNSTEMMGDVQGWVDTQPVNTTGWYNLSFASVSLAELTDGPLPAGMTSSQGFPTAAFQPSLTDQALHGRYTLPTVYGTCPPGTATAGDPFVTTSYVVFDMYLGNSRVWAASPMDALTEGITGTVTVYSQTTITEPPPPDDPTGPPVEKSTWSNSGPVPLQDSSYFHPHAPFYVKADGSDVGPGGGQEDMSAAAGAGGQGGMYATPADNTSDTGDQNSLGNVLTNLGRAVGEYFFCGVCCNTSPFLGMLCNLLHGSGAGGGDPVDLENGTFQHTDTDIVDNTTAYPFGQERSVDDQGYSTSSANGVGQVDDDLPQAVQDPGGQGFGVVLSGTDTAWFYANNFSEDGTPVGDYEPTYADGGSISVNSDYIYYTEADGTQFKFYAFDTCSCVDSDGCSCDLPIDPTLQGKFVSRTDPDGTVSQAVYNGADQLVEVDRYKPGQSASLDSFVYSYYQDGPAAGLLQSVTWQERPTAGSAWSAVRTATYDYYAGPTTTGDGEYIGSAGDLESATVTDPSGGPIGTTYYRYAQVVTPTGTKDQLSYVFEAEAYARLSAAVADPLTASDATVAPYASLILSYDGQGRVVSQQVAGMGASAAGGQGTYGFSYSVNTDYVTTLTQAAANPIEPFYWVSGAPRLQSQVAYDDNGDIAQQQDPFDPTGSNLPDYNTWWYKAVVTDPDGSTETTYLNAAGETMLDVLTAAGGTQHWATYDQYDNDGRLIFQAEPSAVTGYDATVQDSPSLTVNAEGQPLLSPDGGLIETVTYAVADNYNPDLGPIGAAIQPSQFFVQQGTNGTPVLVETDTYQMEYYIGDYAVARETSATTYRNDTGTTDAALGASTTAYQYQFGGSGELPTQVQASDPPIPSSEDGSDDPLLDQETDNYDGEGRLISIVDGVNGDGNGNGYTTAQTYDPVSGAVATQTLDAGGSGQNLTTTTTSDFLGRPTSVKDADGNVTDYTYDDADHEVRAYVGWHEVGTTGTYTATGPVEVYREDWSQGYTETLTYAAPVLAEAVPTGTDPITGLQSLDRQYVNAAGQVVADRSYFDLTGLAYSTAPILGTVNVNYYQTAYGYDDWGRQNEVIAPTGTITETAYDAQDRLTEEWVGTSPSNLTDVADYQYDDGTSGDGDLTQVTLHAGAGQPDQVTTYGYDWRDRQVVQVTGPVGSAGSIVTYTTYDNWDLPTSVATYAGAGYAMASNGGVPDAPAASALRSLTTTAYDELGQAYQSTTYSVDQSTGAVGAAATTSYWYDGRGNVVATESPTGLWTKEVYDGADRLVETYQTDGAGYAAALATGDATAAQLYAAATGVAGDHVLSQTQYVYDGDGNVVETIESDRLPSDADATTGALAGSGGGTVPARVSYTVDYYDAADRLTGTLDLGTDGGQPLAGIPTEPGAYTDPPLDGVTFVQVPQGSLWTAYAYDAAGNVSAVTDPRGLVTAYTYDALSRVTETVADYTGGFAGTPIAAEPSTDSTPTGGTPTDSTNQTTAYTYDGDDDVTSMTAVMPSGEASQTTDYVYGVTTATGSGVDDNDLLAKTEYPDPTTGAASASQGETYTYDALGDQTTYTDRNGTTHAYSYDALGRLTSDQVTVFGSGVDQTVDKLGYTYTDAGELATATSYDQYGNIVNQTSDTYDGFGQLASEAQAVTGAVTTSTPSSTPTVGYTYDANEGDRQTGLVYPDGRTVSYNYAGTLDGAVSRLSSISDGTGTIQSYGYLGLDTPLVTTDGNGVTETTTLDGLGRIASQTYVNGSGTTVDGQSYTYDADGNVLSDRNAVLPNQSEVYTYDGLNRLVTFSRGTLTSDGTAISGAPTGTESWSLDALGNWESNTLNGVTTTRTNDAQNQVTTVTTPAAGGGNTTATLGYDKDGNTLTDETGQQYVYDAWNRLVTVKNSSGTTIAAYTYDAQGRRVTETHGSTTTDLYYDDNWNVIEERQAGQTTTQYVWNPNGTDELVERDDQPNGSGTLTRRLYAEQDADGNVTSLTDASGTVVERYVYDPYGTVTVLNPDGTTRGDGTAASSSYSWVYLHQGLRLDTATGTYDSLGREYDPSLGRFLEADPAGYVDGGSRYQYELGNPVLYDDPSGLEVPTLPPPPATPPAGGALTAEEALTTGGEAALGAEALGGGPLDPIADALALAALAAGAAAAAAAAPAAPGFTAGRPFYAPDPLQDPNYLAQQEGAAAALPSRMPADNAAQAASLAADRAAAAAAAQQANAQPSGQRAYNSTPPRTAAGGSGQQPPKTPEAPPAGDDDRPVPASKLRDWARQNGYVLDPSNPDGPETWIDPKSGEWRLKIKSPSDRPGIDPNSQVPRASARNPDGSYVNPITGETGTRGKVGHIPIDPNS